MGKEYKSFPETGHTKSTLDFMNKSISDFHSNKGTGNKYNGFGPATFPSSKIRSMDFAMHDSSGGPPKAQEGWGLLLETGEQISSGDKKITLLTSRCQRKCVFLVGIHIINTFTGFGIDNRGNVVLLEQRKTVTQFQVF
jgi:hypothetical protein